MDLSLIAGPVPTAVTVLGGLGFLYLVIGRTRRWWVLQVPVCVLVGVATAAAVALVVAVLGLFPDVLPIRVLAWTTVAVTAVSLVVARRRSGWRRRALALLALLAVTGTSLVKVNAFYGYRPTLAAVLELPPANQIALDDLPRTPWLTVAHPRQALSSTWHSPPGMPAAGRIAAVSIPGRLSHFPARMAWLYLPPAYLGFPRARLPVLVLVPGQPGGPQDWLLAGRLSEVMDAFAAAHDGLAPIVVMPDVTGSALGNTLCLDSRLGAAETYLADDVPAWAASALDVDTSRLAIGGFSFGGTCALQMAVHRPDVYRTFLDISGQVEPTLGNHARTIAAAFGGDAAAYDRVDPLQELRTTRLPTTAAVLVVGRNDDVYRPQAERVAAAARVAGVTVSLIEVPGQHSWSIATGALARTLPWISGRIGLIDPIPAPAPDTSS